MAGYLLVPLLDGVDVGPVIPLEPSQICDLAATLIRAGEQLERIPADYRIWLVDGFSSGRPGQRGG